MNVPFIGYEPGEPTAMIDPIATAKVVEMLRETVRRDRGVLFISYDRRVLAAVSRMSIRWWRATSEERCPGNGLPCVANR
ncbi:ATP-binding cassette domain-containing protein [Corynebacterium parakroppenstedtii]|uniref:ATP-binding cassette domain-containing protein n=1 Tax=Corynebacterium parakroppenstedtii TaxID=2828363 RepID=UPI001F2EE02A|nr:ABC transporter ATP-binding protein [Corynebacterium parakroppenstedtii]